MSESAGTPAAPAATSSTPSSSPGAPPAPRPNAPGRLADGKFAATVGATKAPAGGVEAKGDAAEATAEKVKEPYRFKSKLKVYGQEEDVDLDEDGIRRELQISRAEKKQLAQMREEVAKHKALIDRLKTDPDGALAEAGLDPDELALKRVKARIDMEAMSEEQRAAMEHQRRADAAEAKLKEHEEREAGAKRALQKQHQQQAIKAEMKQVLEKVGMEDKFEALYLALETRKLMQEKGLDLSPDELATETKRRMGVFVNNYLGSPEQPDAKHLRRVLGEKRVMALLEDSIAEWESSQGVSAPRREEVVAPPSQGEEPRYTTAADVDRYLREKTRRR